MSTLSAKFAKLTNSGSQNTGGNRARVQQNIASQTNKRAAQSQARRTGSAPQNTKQKPAMKGRAGGKPVVGGVKKSLRKGGKGSKKGKKDENKKPVSKDDLDMDMDKYWHAAGKGPDPVVASLDRDMDEYFQKKSSAPAQAPASEVAMAEE